MAKIPVKKQTSNVIKLHNYILTRESENLISIVCENKLVTRKSQTVIRYSNGSLGFDDPLDLPMYIKNKIRLMFKFNHYIPKESDSKSVPNVD